MDSSQPKSASPSSSASASSSSSTIWEFSGTPTTSYSFFPVREEEEEVAAKEAEDDSDRPSLLVQQQTGVGYHVHYPATTEDEEISRLIRDDTWSCIIVVLTFWFFGNEGFAQWLEDISYPNTTLSWNVIHGSGIIQQDIFQSSTYYVAVGNLNQEEVEVPLHTVCV